MSDNTLITPEQLSQCMPRIQDAEEWAPLLNDRLFQVGIVEPNQVAAFIAQTGHESLDYTVLEENLNYSADALRKFFGKYFSSGLETKYARNPEKIANRVYANRMGNGSEDSGDGWNYRGRGVLQVTGRNNYAKCSKYIWDDETILLDSPDYLLDKEAALMSAIWYWDVNNLKAVENFNQLTKLVNGGYNGLSDRQARFDRAMKVLA